MIGTSEQHLDGRREKERVVAEEKQKKEERAKAAEGRKKQKALVALVIGPCQANKQSGELCGLKAMPSHEHGGVRLCKRHLKTRNKGLENTSAAAKPNNTTNDAEQDVSESEYAQEGEGNRAQRRSGRRDTGGGACGKM
eukprot:comp19676_c0_seq1/m.23331 comp19676_c0_seq1/g.23331  ORF comp19676_c0_seq1/g.23331 comp19676_c0_seq1/m.23331 type:complete len:139 (-) comp19676_c0_seq1:150-566(-)